MSAAWAQDPFAGVLFGRIPMHKDGDSVVIRGWCEGLGAARIGFGDCWGTVLPAIVGRQV